jgi:hypothetical protein
MLSCYQEVSFVDPNRKYWNEQHQLLRKNLSGTSPEQAIEIFLVVHAMVHALEVSRAEVYSFDAEVWDDLPEQAARCIPHGCDHSIAWMIWHIARIEDMTVNVLAAREAQVFFTENWGSRLNLDQHDTGNTLTPASIADLSTAVDLSELRAYRTAVGLRTRQVITQLSVSHLQQKVETSRLEMLLQDGSVLADAAGLLDYWGSKTVAGLLLMPPTRHNFVHLNEAARLKPKLLRLVRSL